MRLSDAVGRLVPLLGSRDHALRAIVNRVLDEVLPCTCERLKVEAAQSVIDREYPGPDTHLGLHIKEAMTRHFTGVDGMTATWTIGDLRWVTEDGTSVAVFGLRVDADGIDAFGSVPALPANENELPISEAQPGHGAYDRVAEEKRVAALLDVEGVAKRNVDAAMVSKHWDEQAGGPPSRKGVISYMQNKDRGRPGKRKT